MKRRGNSTLDGSMARGEGRAHAAYYTLQDVDPDTFNAALSDGEDVQELLPFKRASKGGVGSSTSQSRQYGTFAKVGGKYKYVPNTSLDDVTAATTWHARRSGGSRARRNPRMAADRRGVRGGKKKKKGLPKLW